MKQPEIEIRDDFPSFHEDLARLVIAFGRLERTVLLAIKNLCVTLGISKNYEEGLLEAVKNNDFNVKCGYLCRLFARAYGDAEADWCIATRIERIKELGRRRNKYIHGAWTAADGRVVLMGSRKKR